MVSGRIAILTEALTHLAAEPHEQEERFRGPVVRDELALDYANGFESLASLPWADALNEGTVSDLRVIYEKLSVGPDDSLWSEDLKSPRWSEIRRLAADVLGRL
jgi:hypothetical protein